jgi:hypothetical protein
MVTVTLPQRMQMPGVALTACPQALQIVKEVPQNIATSYNNYIEVLAGTQGNND